MGDFVAGPCSRISGPVGVETGHGLAWVVFGKLPGAFKQPVLATTLVTGGIDGEGSYGLTASCFSLARHQVHEHPGGFGSGVSVLKASAAACRAAADLSKSDCQICDVVLYTVVCG